MTQFQKITEDHLIDIHPRLKEYAQYPYPYLRMQVRNYQLQGECYAGVDSKGKCFILGGTVKLHPGVAHAWMLISPEIKDNKIGFMRMVKKFVNSMEKDGFHRIQADIPEEMKEWIRILERVGFKNEGLMTAYTSKKENQYRMAYIRL